MANAFPLSLIFKSDNANASKNYYDGINIVYNKRQIKLDVFQCSLGCRYPKEALHESLSYFGQMDLLQEPGFINGIIPIIH